MRMFRSQIVAACFLLSSLAVNGQVGGDNVYEFLNLTHSGLVSSLGGTNVSLYIDNINMAYHNPSMLSSSTNGNIALNYVNYFAGINYGLASYGWSIAEEHNFAGGITYLNYGSFVEADESGVITGETFKASEYAFPLTYSTSLDTLYSVGITFKPILSHLEDYTSVGFAFDLGAGYHTPSGLFSAGLVVKNIGLQVTRYAGEPRQKLPFEIEAGISQKLAHAPIRFSLTLKHIERYNLIYQYDDSSTTEEYFMDSKFMENLLRHVIVGVEFIPHKNFYVSAGYNHQRRRELGLNTKLGGRGFCWGFGINTSVINLEFARASYHLAGSLTNISLILKPGRLFKMNL